MKKSTVIILALSFMVILAVSNVSPASAAIAPGTYTDHQSANGNVRIDIEGHPVITISGIHYDYGDLGSGDVIIIRRYLSGFGQYLPVAIITDIPQRIDLFALLYAGYPTSIQLISDSSSIKTTREGKSKNIHVVWKTEIAVPDELWGPPGGKILVPGFTLPPGMLIFRGHGDAFSDSSTTESASFRQTVAGAVYYGDATFVCPTWDFGGPVGVEEGTYRTKISLDTTVVTTIK